MVSNVNIIRIWGSGFRQGSIFLCAAELQPRFHFLNFLMMNNSICTEAPDWRLTRTIKPICLCIKGDLASFSSCSHRLSFVCRRQGHVYESGKKKKAMFFHLSGPCLVTCAWVPENNQAKTRVEYIRYWVLWPENCTLSCLVRSRLSKTASPRVVCSAHSPSTPTVTFL